MQDCHFMHAMINNKNKTLVIKFAKWSYFERQASFAHYNFSVSKVDYELSDVFLKLSIIVRSHLFYNYTIVTLYARNVFNQKR